MTLIKSISGIRGTIGGTVGSNLTPIDIVECTLGYGVWAKMSASSSCTIVIGRDGRISGHMVNEFVIQTLISLGIDVIDLGLSTTPTVEMAVTAEKADGGIVITASHNPRQWNALKFLNNKGEFISAKDGRNILTIINEGNSKFVEVDDLGKRSVNGEYITYHVDKILALALVDSDLVKSRNFKVIVDCINSTGAISMAPLLEALGCEYQLINAEMNGEFSHNPEPLEKNVKELISAVKNTNADLGIAVDPDVDRLAFIDEMGSYIGEEYTIVVLADYILANAKGNRHVVSNMSSSAALKLLAEKHNSTYSASPVGEVNVVSEMKETNAIFGGEGNGGVIYPELHYGRDALVGVALLLTYMAKSNKTLSELCMSYAKLVMVKEKIPLKEGMEFDKLLEHIQNSFPMNEIDTRDGIKIWFDNDWVHLRKSNTEPIIRLYAEASTEIKIKDLTDIIVNKIDTFAG